MTLAILLAGCGSIGSRHAGNLKALAEQNGMALELTVCDADAGAARRLADMLGVRAAGGLDAALAAGNYDACVICTPNHLHVPHAMAALEAGVAVFLEKPAAASAGEAAALARECEARGARLMVGCNLRFHPGVRALRQCLKEDRIGRVLYARAIFAHALPNWRPGTDYRDSYSARHNEGGGIILDAVHEPDYLAHLLGEPELASSWVARSGHLDIDVEDIATYVLRHASGAISFVHADYLRQDKFRACEIVGEAGTLVWESEGKAPERVTVRCYDAGAGRWEEILTLEAYTQNDQYLDEMKFFVDAVRDDTPMINSPDEAAAVLACIEKMRPAAPLSAAMATTEKA